MPGLIAPAHTISEMPRTGYAGRVLLADDDPSLRTALSRILARNGYVVTTAADGGQALNELKAGHRFDVVVSDLDMPGADGLSLLRTVRGNDLHLPVVLLTGSPALASAVAAVEYGAFRYLTKPASPAVLLDVVGRAVQRYRLAPVRREAARELEGQPRAQNDGMRAHFGSALGSLWMATQPIVSWRTRAIFAYEALVRNDDPVLRDPCALFDVAEKIRHTTTLGRAIRSRVAESMSMLPPSCPMFLNVHASDLEDPDLLSEDGVLSPFAGQVVLEITERTGLDQVGNIALCLTRLRKLGYRIALDDLGTGYAGLSSLAQLEPDIVKVDMSLVRGIDSSSLKQKLFRTVTSLCNDLGVTLIAEGVETPGERDCAVALGGDLFQGFLFAHPGPGFPPARY
jgi:EAL domain-containing protein (putative c-di-GMP-specific phosphodiesterase class I)/CheY-like chemotaxis protein